MTDRYKLFHFYEPEFDSWRLIDRKNDPHELNNAYDSPELADVRKTLHKELDRLRTELNVPLEDPASSFKSPRDARRKKPVPEGAGA